MLGKRDFHKTFSSWHTGENVSDVNKEHSVIGPIVSSRLHSQQVVFDVLHRAVEKRRFEKDMDMLNHSVEAHV